MPTQHRILALVYHGFEALDLFGPLGNIVPRSDYYTLKLVNVHHNNRGAAPPPQHSLDLGVETSIKNGIGILPNNNLSLADDAIDDEPVDTLFIPGGFGMMLLLEDPFLLRQIGRLVERAANVFTVCTGSLVLAATGKLDGREATTNKRSFDEMTPKFPDVRWQKRARWVEDGKFLTSSGVTAGIDAGFAFLAYTYVSPEHRDPTPQTASADGDATAIPGFNKEKALEHAHAVAYGIEYRWHMDAADDPFVDPPQKSSGTG